MGSVGAAAATVTPSVEKHRLRNLLIGALALLVLGALAQLLGWNIRGWFEELWDTIRTISWPYIVGAVALLTVQTVTVAFAWFWILKYAYPDSGVRWRAVLAAYAASVGLNGILPANLGTAMMLLMFLVIVSGSTFAGILGGYAVEKIFFTVVGAFVYLYLFLTVGGSFDIKFSFVHAHPWATAIVLIGGAVLIVWLVNVFWPRVRRWWEQAKQGGRILAAPRVYLSRVFLPSFISWFAMLGVMAVLLAAYDIPVTFHTLMRVTGGNSIANVTSVTPGGVGVTQAFNVATLKGVTTAANATAYSVAQQLISTAWNLLFALILVVWAFGWTGGKGLVGQSYVDAKARAAEQSASRKARKEAKRAARRASR